MIRIASQLLVCAPGDVRRLNAIELNTDNVITGIFNLEDLSVESAHTQFLDGIISPGIVSLSENNYPIESLTDEWCYYTIESLDLKNIRDIHKLILDFGSSDNALVNDKLILHATSIMQLSIFDLINACCFNPALACGKNNNLSLYNKAKLVLWENTDLAQKKVTDHSSVRSIV